MKLQGKIVNWNDDKGFGFVEPNGGGERAFVHIKAFNPRSRRPVNGEVIIYKLVRDKSNRYKAENVKFARADKSTNKQNKARGASTFGGVFAIVFCCGLLVSVFIGKLSLVVAVLYIVMSFVAFIAYAIDKSAAKNGQWRTKESTLHMISLIGGWPGAFFAMRGLRHKSSKKEFKNVYWVTVFLNLGGLYWLHIEEGESFLNSLVFPLLMANIRV